MYPSVFSLLTESDMNNTINVTESQLDNHWSNQGAVATAKKTHESIRTALSRHTWPSDFTYDVYLQGSYKNSTNIYGDSDVDVVVELTSIFKRDLSRLTEPQKEVYRNNHSSASQSLSDFRREVKQALRSHYNNDLLIEDRVTQKDKCIKVDTGDGYLDADVVVCQTYRIYVSQDNSDPEAFDWIHGITFDTQSGNWIRNYPKLHYEYGVEKNSDTNQRFKPMVRCFKNARSHLVNKGYLSSETAPSYFVECLIYNASNDCFVGNYSDSFENIIDDLGSTDLTTLRAQNRLTPLFGDTSTTWNVDDAIQTLDAWTELLNS